MTMPSRFEDLQVWRKARELARKVYDVTDDWQPGQSGFPL